MRREKRFRATRRDVLKAGIAGGAAMMLPWRLRPFGGQFRKQGMHEIRYFVGVVNNGFPDSNTHDVYRGSNLD